MPTIGYVAIAIIVLFFLARLYKRGRRGKLGAEDYYSVRTYCDNCDHCNFANYEKGKAAYGAKITCGKCGRTYYHRSSDKDPLKPVGKALGNIATFLLSPQDSKNRKHKQPQRKRRGIWKHII